MDIPPKWHELKTEWLVKLTAQLRQRNYSIIYKRYGDKIGLPEQECKEWARWMYRSQREAGNPDMQPLPKTYEIETPYWLDEDRDVYMVQIKSRKYPLAVPGETWRALVEAYSNWDGAPASINEICRKFGMARRTVTELLRIMGTTHDSSPWTNEHLADAEPSALTEDLLRRKEEKVLVDAERKEWSRIKKDAMAFRRLDLLSNRLSQRFAEIETSYLPPKLAIKDAVNPWCAVVSPTDFHWGSYAPEFGGAPYNRDTAKRLLFERSEGLISRLGARGRPECLYLALGGDGLHIDNMQSTTTQGTPQSIDGSPEELAWTWVMLCKDYVDFMRQLCPVKVLCIPGNHDRYTTVLLRAAMAGWFSTADDVEVVEELNTRQHILYGKNLLTFMHGDIGKVRDWPAIVAGEVPELWGVSQNRFIFTGHLHTERELPTFGDVVVYRMPSLAGTDRWHHTHGYKSRRALIAYVVDKERGVVAQEIEPCGSVC